MKHEKMTRLCAALLLSCAPALVSADDLQGEPSMGRPIYVGPADRDFETSGGNTSIDNRSSGGNQSFFPTEAGVGDDLGDHRADENLVMGGNRVVGVPLNTVHDNEATSKHYVDSLAREMYVEINNLRQEFYETNNYSSTATGTSSTPSSDPSATPVASTPPSCPQGITQEQRQRQVICPIGGGYPNQQTVHETRTATTPFGTCNTSYGEWYETHRTGSCQASTAETCPTSSGLLGLRTSEACRNQPTRSGGSTLFGGRTGEGPGASTPDDFRNGGDNDNRATSNDGGDDTRSYDTDGDGITDSESFTTGDEGWSNGPVGSRAFDG